MYSMHRLAVALPVWRRQAISTLRLPSAASEAGAVVPPRSRGMRSSAAAFAQDDPSREPSNETDDQKTEWSYTDEYDKEGEVPAVQARQGDRGRNEAQPEGSTSSYLDELFKAPDSFQRDDDLMHRQRPQRASAPSPFPSGSGHAILDTAAHRHAEAELNKEWEDTGSALSSPLTGGRRSGAPSYRLGQRPHAPPQTSQMTKEELAAFEHIFSEVLQSDRTHMTTANDDEKLFGSSLGNEHNQRLRIFWAKTARQRQQMRSNALRGGANGGGVGGIAARSMPPPRASALALIRERVTAGGLDDEKIAQGIDEAREQIQSCQTPVDTWQWALNNVWPPASASAPAAAEGRSDERRFGISTPFYAPVLHLLFRELRDRFRAPHTALAILQIVRNLGPESFVLGCTPHLYAEAIRTRWHVLRDLQGARDLVIEAKEAGILSGLSPRTFGARSSFTSPHHQQNGRQAQFASPDELANLQSEQLIVRVVDEIKEDVRRMIFTTQRLITSQQQEESPLPNGPETSYLLQHQSQLIREMSDAIRSGTRASSRATAKSNPSDARSTNERKSRVRDYQKSRFS